MNNKKRVREDLDSAARRLTDGHFVQQTMPGVDSSDVSDYIRRRKEAKYTMSDKEKEEARH